MPKIQEFSLSDYKDHDYNQILTAMLEDKIKKISLCGATVTNRIGVYSIKISNDDFNKFKQSDKAKKMLLLNYNNKKSKYKIKYDRLKKLCDFCLYDVKPYNKLMETIEEFSYCGAISELEIFEKRYMRSSGYTKAKYRARKQEYTKIKC